VANGTGNGPPDLDGGAFEAWLRERVPVAGPVTWSLLAGGRSNLSYRPARGPVSCRARSPAGGDSTRVPAAATCRGSSASTSA
jgi:hypothetical protein